MKIFIALATMFLSQGAFAEAYWSCQCFENIDAVDANGGIEIPATKANTLNEAQSSALEACKASDSSITVASCLRMVRSDH